MTKFVGCSQDIVVISGLKHRSTLKCNKLDVFTLNC